MNRGDGWSDDTCLIPEPHYNYAAQYATKRVQCAKQNAANTCEYWTPKRSLLTRIENVLFWGGK